MVRRTFGSGCSARAEAARAGDSPGTTRCHAAAPESVHAINVEIVKALF